LPQDEPAHSIREDPRNPDVLFAGLERGVWVSFDRGVHWRSLRLNMPAVAVYDLRIQPRADDLIAGTHGRGVFILDDLTPLEGYAAASAAGEPALFATRPAYSWYYWWRTQYGMWDTGCCSPAGEFSAADPPYGCEVDYYLPRSLQGAPALQIYDASGRLVRTMAGSNLPGLNRVTWDLADSPPVPWYDTGDWNQGPADGPPVVPGQYRATLTAGAQRLTTFIEVRPDPRAHWTQAQYEARYEFLKRLDDELSAIDNVLNRLDRLRAGASVPLREAIRRLYRHFTSGVQNSEDNEWMPDRLRERLTILQGDVALSQGPPLPPHQREAAAIAAEFDRAMAEYRRFLSRWSIEKNE
jgi:hypothetical protein